MASAKKASPKPPKPDKEAVKGLEDQVLASLQASQTVDTIEGVQAGLFSGGNLKKLVQKLISALLEGSTLVVDGSVSPDDARRLVEIAVRTIQDLIAMRKAPENA